jgi:CRP-like cAMP-binding protein
LGGNLKMDCSCHMRDGKTCLEMVPIFSTLNKEEKLEVAGITSKMEFSKGQMIYMAGAEIGTLYVVHVGKVKITKIAESGKEQVLRVLGPGEFMGELSLFNHAPATANAQAQEDTSICAIAGDKLKSLLKKYPAIALKVIEELSQRLEKTENLLKNISLYSVEKRLGNILLNLANDRGIVELKMSKRDFASQIGMTQETLSRQLSAFQDLGFIRQEGHRRIILLNPEALKSAL